MEFRRGSRIAAGILLIAAAAVSIALHIWNIPFSVKMGYSYIQEAIQIGINVLLIVIGVMILIRKFPVAGILTIVLTALCIPLLIGNFSHSGAFNLFAFSSVWSVLLPILTLAANGSIAAGLFLQNGKSKWLLLTSGILLLVIPYLQMGSRVAVLERAGRIEQAEWSGAYWFFDTLRMIPNTVAWILLGRYFAE